MLVIPKVVVGSCFDFSVSSSIQLQCGQASAAVLSLKSPGEKCQKVIRLGQSVGFPPFYKLTTVQGSAPSLTRLGVVSSSIFQSGSPSSLHLCHDVCQLIGGPDCPLVGLTVPVSVSVSRPCEEPAACPVCSPAFALRVSWDRLWSRWQPERRISSGLGEEKEQR